MPKHPRKLALIFFAGFLTVLLHSPSYAQAVGAGRGDTAGSGGTRSIQGRVFFPDRGEGKFARVTLDSPDIGTRSTSTDPDGNFYFNNLASNTYVVTVDGGSDYETARESLQVEGALVSKLNIQLQFKKGAGPLAGVPEVAVKSYQGALNSLKKDDSKAAVDQLQQAIAAYPNFGLAQNELGTQYLRQGDPTKAVELFAAAEKNLPGASSPYLNHGIALVELKKFADARKPLQEALKRNDKSGPAHMYLGIAQVGLREFEDAEKEFLKAVKVGGDSVAQAHYYLGGIYWARKDNKKAADEMEAYLKLRPNDPKAERLRTTVQELRSKQ